MCKPTGKVIVLTWPGTSTVLASYFYLHIGCQGKRLYATLYYTASTILSLPGAPSIQHRYHNTYIAFLIYIYISHCQYDSSLSQYIYIQSFVGPPAHPEQVRAPKAVRSCTMTPLKFCLAIIIPIFLFSSSLFLSLTFLSLHFLTQSCSFFLPFFLSCGRRLGDSPL